MKACGICAVENSANVLEIEVKLEKSRENFPSTTSAAEIRLLSVQEEAFHVGFLNLTALRDSFEIELSITSREVFLLVQ